MYIVITVVHAVITCPMIETLCHCYMYMKSIEQSKMLILTCFISVVLSLCRMVSSYLLIPVLLCTAVKEIMSKCLDSVCCVVHMRLKQSYILML